MSGVANALVQLDRDLAEVLFGRRRGRPTISRRAGARIARAIGLSICAGTTAFHWAVVVGGLFVFTRTR